MSRRRLRQAGVFPVMNRTEEESSRLDHELHHEDASMAILAAETALFPDTLLEQAVPESDGACWRVVHTKPRQEKSLARELIQGEVPFYLPLRKRRLFVR